MARLAVASTETVVIAEFGTFCIEYATDTLHRCRNYAASWLIWPQNAHDRLNKNDLLRNFLTNIYATC